MKLLTALTSSPSPPPAPPSPKASARARPSPSGSRGPPSNPSCRRTATRSARSRSRAAAMRSTRPTRTASAPTWPSTPRRSESSTTPKPARTDQTRAQRPAMIRVWDPFVRAFHWALALSFAVAWLSSEEAETLHAAAGYVAGALVAARVVWGLRRVRLRALLAVRPAAGDGRRLSAGRSRRGSERRFVGHNPAGGAMIVVLLGRAGGDRGDGLAAHHRCVLGLDPPSSARTRFSRMASCCWSPLHLGGVALASLRHRENLVRAMVIGDKRAAGPGDVA